MSTAVTVLQLLLLVPFIGGGVTKLTVPYARFTKLPFQEWANDFKPEHVRLIGVFEASAALGLIVSLLTPSLALLAPLITVGMALVMAGAMATHLRRSEYVNMGGNFVWLGMALVVAYGTLGGFTA